MKVYVLTRGYDYEGENLCGVYATLEDACVAATRRHYEDDWVPDWQPLLRGSGLCTDVHGGTYAVYECVIGADQDA